MGGCLQPVFLLWLAAMPVMVVSQDNQLVENFTNQGRQVIPFNINNSNGTKLVINGNKITLNETDRLALASYPALEELYLDGNLVSHIQAKFFSVLPKLRTLSLARNNIRSLDWEAFSGLDVLTSLDLSNNMLKSLPAQLTKGLNSLQLLCLQENPWNCSCPLLKTIGQISAANVSFGDLLVTCASPPDRADTDVFKAAALCSTPPLPTIVPYDQPEPTTPGRSQQPSSPTPTLKTTRPVDVQTKEPSPVVGNTWKFAACVAALAAATSLLIVCAVKAPSWYKLFHNYRHRRLHQVDDDNGNFVSTVFSKKGSRGTQTFSFEHRKGREEEEDDDWYFEDPYIKSEEEHAGGEVRAGP